ncbi:MAG: protein kinase, partial [Verrucomicrobiales bacterium]|nr:protein kinase [Verrucomicrobiales bacterium]
GTTECTIHEPEGRARHSVRAEAQPEESGAQGTDPPYQSRSILSAGRPYFVMELVQGVPITEFCDKNKLPAKERLKLFIQVCQAIQSAHQKGIIHRDIKPSNVLVTLHHGEPMPKVIDFGIAKATNQKLTEKTLFTNYATMIGTPAYMSPEQAEMSSMDVDTRTDVYALGVLLYELLTGTTPFPEKRLRSLGYGEMQRVIMEEEPERPSTRLSTMANDQKTVVAKNRGEELTSLSKLLRGDLDWVVMKCLEKDRSHRYETANSLATDLARHLNYEPVVARPPSAAYRVQKAFRRNKLAFAGGAAIALALLAGLATTSWQWHRAEHERGAAQHEAYLANMNLAQTAWEQNNVPRVRSLLRETASAPERGFEWYYWQRQTHLEVLALRGHGASILAVAYSPDPDGRRILTGSADHLAKVWDARTGAELFSLTNHGAAISSVAFSPDGERIVTGSWDQTAKVWDAATGKELFALIGHTNQILSVAFSPDSRRIVTGSFDKTARVWDASTGKELRILEGHTLALSSVSFSPDGRWVLSGSWDKTAKVWDAVTGHELYSLVGHRDGVLSVAFSPDGQRIVTGGQDRDVKLWDAATGKELRTLSGHSVQVAAVAFSPDGQRIATAGDDQTVRVWSATGGNELLAVKRHGSRISSVAFSPDSQRIVTGGGSVQSEISLALINIGSGDQTARIWEASSDQETFILEAHTNWVQSVAFSPDGQRIVTGSRDQTARVWEASTGKLLRILQGHTGEIRSVAISPDGQRIVTGSWDKTAKVWDAATGQELFSLVGHSDGIMSVAFSPDGRRIATGGRFDRMAKVWDANNGKEQFTLKGRSGGNGGDGRIWPVAFSPDGRRLVTGNWGGAEQQATIWDSAGGKPLLRLTGQSHYVIAAAFSLDGRRIVTGSRDETAKVWDSATGACLLTLQGHRDQVLSVSFSPDRQRILTGSRDQTAKLWDAATGKELLTFKGHGRFVFSAAFSPDGRRIATASGDGTVRVWDAASPEQVARWQEEEQARTSESRLP